jgi:hypothetical protein
VCSSTTSNATGANRKSVYIRQSPLLDVSTFDVVTLTMVDIDIANLAAQ